MRPLLTGLEPLRCRKVSFSFGVATDMEVGDAAIVISSRMARIETDRLVVVTDFFVEVALLTVGETAVVISIGIRSD